MPGSDQLLRAVAYMDDEILKPDKAAAWHGGGAPYWAQDVGKDGGRRMKTGTEGWGEILGARTERGRARSRSAGRRQVKRDAEQIFSLKGRGIERLVVGGCVERC